MDRTDNPILGWITAPAHTQRDATAKFKWWCVNHGVLRAYANVSIRERRLIPLAERVAIAEQFKTVNAPQPTSDDTTRRAVEWLDSNAYREITTRSLGDALGVTQAVARRLIRDLPHYFKRLNQYRYEVRDHRGERELDKAR